MTGIMSPESGVLIAVLPLFALVIGLMIFLGWRSGKSLFAIINTIPNVIAVVGIACALFAYDHVGAGFGIFAAYVIAAVVSAGVYFSKGDNPLFILHGKRIEGFFTYAVFFGALFLGSAAFLGIAYAATANGREEIRRDAELDKLYLKASSICPKYGKMAEQDQLNYPLLSFCNNWLHSPQKWTEEQAASYTLHGRKQDAERLLATLSTGNHQAASTAPTGDLWK